MIICSEIGFNSPFAHHQSLFFSAFQVTLELQVFYSLIPFLPLAMQIVCVHEGQQQLYEYKRLQYWSLMHCSQKEKQNLECQQQCRFVSEFLSGVDSWLAALVVVDPIHRKSSNQPVCLAIVWRLYCICSLLTVRRWCMAASSLVVLAPFFSFFLILFLRVETLIIVKKLIGETSRIVMLKMISPSHSS
jgi:hypothetical protein